ncbi:DUF3027 domain-containing protein [Leucobacter chromiiresistens]|uniref:DUF3027 domain-containing protein n=1 Tax=Leucobacter chromiiresistens TaxID=1079994 RepID=A0A1H0XR75_9MICO|nr:DUF3027 domain-containing protein [Leucobacter chromiiresistens]SDQ05422.1 Protein of unknown function [Leucobacter chromiiresistens]
MSETELTPDAVLLAARDQARAALAEITDPSMIGADAGYEVEEAHVLTLLFECRLAGYPGWRWAATLARTSEDAPVTVLEVELLPGPDSVIAPDWVPWSERLAQYREGHAKQADAAGDPHDDEAADAEDDELENDFDDDLDGVDLDEDADAFDDDSDDDDSDGDDTDDDDSEDEDIDDDSDDADLFDEDTDDVDDESDDDSEDDDSEDDDSEE